jgi:hypothetical protein
MKCDNCSRDALYKIDRSNANTIYLCRQDLPAHLHTDAVQGKFAFSVEPEPKKKKSVVEPEVVEPEAEEAPAETSDENL